MTQEIHQRAAQKLIAFHREAEQRNEWTFFVDEMYAPECVYVCEYAGTMRVCANGIDEIKATHYGRDMQRGWEGWTFPYLDVYVGNEGRVVTHWMNRGPGKRPDGSIIGPPMPIALYRGISDADANAIVAYLRTVKPVSNKVAKSAFKVPLPPSYGPPVTKRV